HLSDVGHADPLWSGRPRRTRRPCLSRLSQDSRTHGDLRGAREELPSFHGLVLLGLLLVGRTDDVYLCGLVVREAHVPAGRPEAVRDPCEHVIGNHLTALEDLRYFRLRLTGHRSDLPLGDTFLPQ